MDPEELTLAMLAMADALVALAWGNPATFAWMRDDQAFQPGDLVVEQTSKYKPEHALDRIGIFSHVDRIDVCDHEVAHPNLSCIECDDEARIPSEDATYVEFVARPDPEWNGVTCDACRVRLPTLLRELSDALDDVHEGIMEGFREHPETIRASKLYARNVEPTLTIEQRQRHATVAQKSSERNAIRAARRARMHAGKGDAP